MITDEEAITALEAFDVEAAFLSALKKCLLNVVDRGAINCDTRKSKLPEWVALEDRGFVEIQHRDLGKWRIVATDLGRAAVRILLIEAELKREPAYGARNFNNP